MQTRRAARINVKVLIIVLVIGALIAVGGAIALRIQRQLVASRALAAGQAAIAERDWVTACKQLKIYLAKRPDDFEALHQFAQANLEFRPRSPGHTMQAIRSYRRLLRETPTDDAICEKLAGLYVEVGNYSEAAYICRQRLAAEPTDVDAALTLGTALVAQRKSQEAIDVLTQLADEHPDQIQAFALLSSLELQEGTPAAADRALEWLDRAVSGSPESAEARVLRGRFYRIFRRDSVGASSELQEAESRLATNPNLRLALAEEWLMLGHYDRAAGHRDVLRGIDDAALESHDIYPPDMMLAVVSLDGLLALRQDEVERAGEIADQGLASLPDGHRQTAFLPLASELYIAAGRLDDARESLARYREELGSDRASTKAFSDDLVYLESLAEVAAGNDYEAIGRLETLLVTSPSHLRARKLLAASFVSTRQWRRAAREFKEYLQAAPEDAGALIQYAEVCRRSLDFNEFAVAARSAERLMPDSLTAKKLRIDAEIGLLEQGSRQGGSVVALIAELDALVVPRAVRSEFDMLRVRLETLQGHNDEAVAILERVTENLPDALPPLLELVGRYADEGKSERAIATCRKAVRAHPAVAEPRIILARLLVADGQWEDAVAVLQELPSEKSASDYLKTQVFLAQLHMQHGDRTDGVSLLRQLAADHEGDFQLHRVLLTLPEVQEDQVEAQQLVDALRAIEGERGVRWPVEQARVLLRRDDWQDRAAEIETTLTRCVNAEPRWQAPAILLGILYERLQRYGDAESVYNNAIDNDPAAGEVAERLVALLASQERFAEVNTILQRVRADTPGLRTQRVASAMRRGQFDIAIEELRKRVNDDPQDAQARVWLAQILYGSNQDPTQAFALLDEAQAIDADLLEAATTRARITHLESGPEEAEKILNDEIERRGDFVSYLSRARYFAETGRLVEADREFVHLTTIDGGSADGYRLLGTFRQRNGRLEDAIAVWEEGLEKYPDDVETQRSLIKALTNSIDPANRTRGKSKLDEALAQFPNDTELLTARAKLILVEGMPGAAAQAQDILERVVSLESRSADAYLMLIDLARRRGDTAGADDLLTRAFSALPGDFMVDLVHAEIQIERGNLPLARDIALRAQTKGAARAAPRVVLATIAMRAGDAQQARNYADEALRLEPENERAQLLAAHLLFRSGDHGEALQRLEAFRSSDAGSRLVAPLLALAEMYRRTGDMPAALAALDDAARIAPNRTDVVVARLAWFAAAERYDDIVSAVSRRLAERPGDYSMLVSAGPILEATRDPAHIKEAERWYAMVPADSDLYVHAQLALARLAHRGGETDKAVGAYRQVLATAPNHHEALNDLAWITGVQLGNLDEAIALADRGVAGHPNDPHLLDTRGTLFLKAGRMPEAQRDLELCLVAAAEIPATRASALLHLGNVHLQRGDPQLAKQRLEEAATLDEAFGVYSAAQRAEAARLLEEASDLISRAGASE